MEKRQPAPFEYVPARKKACLSYYPLSTTKKRRIKSPKSEAGLTHNAAYEKDGHSYDVRSVSSRLYHKPRYVKSIQTEQRPDEWGAETGSNPVPREEGRELRETL